MDFSNLLQLIVLSVAASPIVAGACGFVVRIILDRRLREYELSRKNEIDAQLKSYELILQNMLNRGVEEYKISLKSYEIIVHTRLEAFTRISEIINMASYATRNIIISVEYSSRHYPKEADAVVQHESDVI